MTAERRVVREAFARAAQCYDSVADFQREAGQRLLALCSAVDNPTCVLDAGCGTGHGLQLIGKRWPDARTIALDFALPMLKQLPAETPAVCADMERLPLTTTSIDLVWSNLALQWCDLGTATRELMRVMRNGAQLAATTLGPGTFAELRHAFRDVDGFRHTNDFIDEAALRATLVAAGLECVTLERAPMTCHYSDLRTLLSSVRDLGASRVVSSNRRPGLMGKSAWRRFAENYERMATPQGLPLTYDTYFILAYKS